MPCSDGRDYMTAKELAAEEIARPFLEVFGRRSGGEATLDDDTRFLCEWLKEHGLPPSSSWDLSRWWRNHQKIDRRREILAKLTPDERETLGFPRGE